MNRLNSRLAEVEDLALNDADKAFFVSYLKLMDWPSSQYVREVLLSLQECEDKYLPKDVLVDSEAGFRGMGCSRGCEVAFQRLEDESRQHKCGRLGDIARWQRLQANDMLKDAAITVHVKPFFIKSTFQFQKCHLRVDPKHISWIFLDFTIEFFGSLAIGSWAWQA